MEDLVCQGRTLETLHGSHTSGIFTFYDSTNMATVKGGLLALHGKLFHRVLHVFVPGKAAHYFQNVSDRIVQMLPFCGNCACEQPFGTLVGLI
jgi:hypothetical protein